MPNAIVLRPDFPASALRGLARRSKDAAQARRRCPLHRRKQGCTDLPQTRIAKSAKIVPRHANRSPSPFLRAVIQNQAELKSHFVLV